ncbi:MAG: hypothetical protein ACREMA_03665, partial [Longimicrobiales bacterium]
MSLLEAIESYHGLLSEELAQDTHAQLTQQLQRRGLLFGDRLLCSVLRPRFLTAQQYRFLQERGRLLLAAVARAHERAMQDAAFRAQFGLLDWEETLLADDPGFAAPSPLSRLDAFFVHERGGLRFTEYNAETPAGNAYNDALADVFLGLPAMRAFLRQYELRTTPTRHMLMHTLLGAYRDWSGSRQVPRIAILDWRNVPTYSEFVLVADYLRRQGLDCVIADPQEAEYRSGRLYISGVQVDLIYKRVLIHELIERCGLDHAVVRAVRERKVCMVNPFRCKILHKKLSLAVLGDERNRDLFDAAEQEVIAAHIPWSRRVEERTTEFHGQTVDLLPFAEQERERLVLKPNDDYGGRGIVLGWEVTPERWSQALQTALHEPFVVQERIEIPTETYPVLVDNQLRFEERILDT